MGVKRILIITTTNVTLNGITSVIMNYYRNIDRSKIQFDFAIGEGIIETIKSEIKELGGNIYILPSRKRKLFKYRRELEKLIEEKNYEIIHAHGNSGTLYFDINSARKAGAKIRIAHSHTTNCKHKMLHKLLKNSLNNETTHPIACSEEAGKWLFTKEFTVINNGVDLEKFKFNGDIRSEVRSALGLNDKFVIGHIGNFVNAKNHSYILEVFKEVTLVDSESVLLLIGDGYLRSDIEEKVRALKLENKVILLGKRPDANKLIQGLDAFLFPSLYEGLPVSLIEVQASGLKAVISDTITKECDITNRIAYLSISENPKIWADELLKLKNRYKRDDVLKLMEASKFNIKNEVRKLEKIYLE